MSQEQRFVRPAVTVLAKIPHNLKNNRNGFMRSTQVLSNILTAPRFDRFDMNFFDARMFSEKNLTSREYFCRYYIIFNTR